jgi:CheY-like chemotaxis protein
MDAIDSARLLRPDLILLDVGLPGLSGIEVLRLLRAGPDTAEVPVVYLTGLAPQLGPRPDGILAKPFTPSLLREAVARFAA